MKIVVGFGCLGSGIKDFDTDIKSFLHTFIDTLNDEKLQDIIISLAEEYGSETYCDNEPCEQCGDYYYEYTLNI